MKFITIYNPTTFEVEFSKNIEDGEQMPENSTEVVCNISALKLCFNPTTQEYYEGATQQEIVDYYTPLLMKRGIEIFVHLVQRAKASSMEKQLDKDYQECLEQVYKLKYDVTKGDKIRPYVTSLLQDEATNDFPVELDYATYSGIVQTKYEAGQLTFDNFISMAERMRSGFLTALERQDIEKARQIIELAESVPEVVTMQELEALTSDLLVLTTRPTE